MAITSNDAKFLLYCRYNQKVNFNSVLTLGRMHLYAKASAVFNNYLKYAKERIPDAVFKKLSTAIYSEPLFELLETERLETMDFSDYESATIIQDLNKPFPASLKNRFDVIIDSGTLEHVFLFPMAIKSCMESIKVGGHFIAITPTNNYSGHGFYQFSPELFFRIFNEENGFLIKKMMICIGNTENNSDEWFEVADPQKVNSRVIFNNNNPTMLSIVAQKIADREIFETNPYQLDYVNTWNAHSEITNRKISTTGLLKSIYRRYFPDRLKYISRNIYSLFTNKEEHHEALGVYNPSHFIKVEI